MYELRSDVIGRKNARALLRAALVVLLTGSARMRLYVEQEPKLVGGGR